MILDYVTLKIIWWFFISGLFILFFILGGWDLGVAILLPFLGKNDDDRRLVINSIGPTWEGNEVWLITAGASLFAAWPIVYSTAFSGLYFAMFLVLIALILRPPSFDFRSKLSEPKWRNLWDWCIFSSGFVPTLIFGVGLGNLFLGLPFNLDATTLQSHYEGNFFKLLHPFAALTGVAAIAIIGLQGGTYLQAKLPDEYANRIIRFNVIFGLIFFLLFLILGIWLYWGIDGYQIQSMQDVQNSVLPTAKQVAISPKGWFANYQSYPWLWALPATALIAIIFAMITSFVHFPTLALFMSSVGIAAALLTANASLFPFIFPSSTHPNHSLTLWDSASSHRTLQYMFWVTVLLVPIVLSYTAWVFKVVSGKLDKKKTLENKASY